VELLFLSCTSTDHAFSLPHSVKLQAIHRFTSTATAVEDMTAIGEGKVSKNLKHFLTEEITNNKKLKNEKLAVSEPKLGALPSIFCFFLFSLFSDSVLSLCRWCHRQEA
jgi:RNA processing factor Prp31